VARQSGATFLLALLTKRAAKSSWCGASQQRHFPISIGDQTRRKNELVWRDREAPLSYFHCRPNVPQNGVGCGAAEWRHFPSRMRETPTMLSKFAHADRHMCVCVCVCVCVFVLHRHLHNFSYYLSVLRPASFALCFKIG
jgi:hypothetical protein